MARLPTPGGDTGSWGDILNAFLEVSHAGDGTLNSGVVGNSQLKSGAVSNSKLSASVQNSLESADNSVQTVNSIAPTAGDVTLTKSDVGLGNVDNTSDANKPVSTATQTALDAKLTASNNLSDLGSASTARTNLGLGSAATSNTSAFEPASLAASTLSTLDGLYQAVLSDSGTLQQWSLSTPATKGSIWAYQGVVYVRLSTGTDSSFIRSNWAELGADPTTIGGGELAAAILTSSFSATLNGTYTDITGLAVSPIIPSNGRGIYIDLICGVTVGTAATSVVFQLYDVTAGAQAAGTGATGLTCAVVSKGYPAAARWRLAPAAGARSYKIQGKITGAGSSVVTVLGQDLGFEAGMYVTAR